MSKFLVGAPLLIVAVLALTFAWGHTFSNHAEAVTPTMDLSVEAADTFACPIPVVGKVCVNNASQFTLIVTLTKAPAGGYNGLQTEIDYSSLVVAGAPSAYKPGTVSAEWTWVDASLVLRSPGAPTGEEGLINHAASTALPALPKSNAVGEILRLQMNCEPGDKSAHVITLVPLSPTNTNGSGVDPVGPTPAVATSDVLTVSCANTPTNTPPPPTATPPDFPQMQKLCLAKGATNATGGSNLCNLFLTHQGSKLPPLTCAAGTNTATFQERLSIPIPVLPDPKDAGLNQQLGAFEFEVHFDDSKICVNIVPGAAAANMLCVVEDKDSSNLEGVARIGCVTLGKTGFPDTTTKGGRHLADIVVRPQPDEWSVIKPNQDNGNAVQLNNVLCELADLQGHPIPVFSCEDADVTIRFLEGDVSPDCSVNALDTQAIAFRWGVEKGSLIFTDFMNLEPSGPQHDNDIDIKDLQFVFGRFGSTCKVPQTPQLPINPKA